jgi:hypothetical protein
MQTLGPLHGIGLTITATMIAAPTFMLVSGITLGYVYTTSPGAYAGFSSKLFERGIFLLTFAHLLLLPSRIYLAPNLAALRSVEMTDTIGFCIVIGPYVVTRLRAAKRLLLSAALVGGVWALILMVPDAGSSVLRALQHGLIGHRDLNWWYSSFPLIPWFGVYLLGTVVGERLLPVKESTKDHNVRVLLRWAAGLAILAVLLELTTTAAPSAGWPDHTALILWAKKLGNPFGKFPPSPAYLLVFSSAGLTLVALTSFFVDRGLGRWLSDQALVIGRASLFVFIIQSYLYYLIEVHWLHPLSRSWPLAFAGSLVVVFVMAKAWLALGGNRLLTFRWAVLNTNRPGECVQ